MVLTNSVLSNHHAPSPGINCISAAGTPPTTGKNQGQENNDVLVYFKPVDGKDEMGINVKKITIPAGNLLPGDRV